MKTLIPRGEITAAYLGLDRSWSSVEIDGVSHAINWQKTDGIFTASLPGISLACSVEKIPNGIKISSSAKLDKPVSMLKLHLICFPALKIDHYFGCGARMGRAKVVKFPAEQETELVNYYYCVLSSGKDSAVISTPLNQRYENYFTGRAVGALFNNGKVTFEVRHNDNTDLIFDPVSITCGDGLEILKDYGRSNVEVGRELSAPPKYGWNTWDYYRWVITEDDVIKNAEFIANDPILKQHIKRIIVDDGWQYCYGEWDANSLFPSGMKSLADKITALGFEPGLWFAPTIVEPHCRIAMRDYDMLAMSEGGQPCLCYQCMKRYGFVLDPTVKKTRDHLRSLFDRYSSMGYRYFKLDFLGSTMEAARFHDRNVSRSQILRMLMDSIAEGVNGRAAILGCNYHFWNGNSHVEAVRVGGDIHSHWDNIKANTISVASMFWANKVLWYNDPDFAIARGPETSDDPDLQRFRPLYPYVLNDSPNNPVMEMNLADATRKEIEVLLSIDLMAAGSINLSDNLPALAQNGLDMLRKLVSAEQGSTGIPLDMLESTLPVYWLQKTPSGHRLLVINWQDTPAAIPVGWNRIGIKPAAARDFWTGAAETPAEVIELAPHSCKLWEF